MQGPPEGSHKRDHVQEDAWMYEAGNRVGLLGGNNLLSYVVSNSLVSRLFDLQKRSIFSACTVGID